MLYKDNNNQENNSSLCNVANGKKWYEKDTDEWTDDDCYEALEDLYDTYH